MQAAPPMTWRGTWTAHVHYDPGHVALLDGVPYVCTQSVRSTDDPSVDSGHWALLLGTP